MGPHISIKGEHVFDILGFPVTNSILTTLLVLIGFYFLASYYYEESRKKDKGHIFYALNGVLKYMYGLFESVLHNKTAVFFPLLLSFFFFILLNNWSGLLPGVGSLLIESPEVHAQPAEHTNDSYATEELYIYDENGQPLQDANGEIITLVAVDDHGNVIEQDTQAVAQTEEDHEDDGEHHSSKIPLFRGGTADLNTTVALAMISVFITQFFGFKYLGAAAHLGKYFNFSSPVMLFVGLLELILEFARILSFAFRLFGNIFAGEVLLTVIPFLLPVFLSFVSAPMFFMEIFVGVVQAMVFTMLSAVFINMAIAKHH